ncbi:PIN domain-containing protein [Spirochaetia bacterium]|nr:PIN domain-containing protein [Spirochaetia bacterium]
MKIVIDTNVIISAAFWGGSPQKVVDMVFNKSVEVVVSNEIIEEYRDIFVEIMQKYPNKQPNFSSDNIVAISKIISPYTHIEICRDPDDNKFIECAIDGDCLFIVSGDDDLLAIGGYDDITILTVKHFLEWLQKNDLSVITAG